MVLFVFCLGWSAVLLFSCIILYVVYAGQLCCCLTALFCIVRCLNGLILYFVWAGQLCALFNGHICVLFRPVVLCLTVLFCVLLGRSAVRLVQRRAAAPPLWGQGGQLQQGMVRLQVELSSFL